MPVVINEISDNSMRTEDNQEPALLDKNAIPRLTPAELRELAKILHEMLRRDLIRERDRMGR